MKSFLGAVVVSASLLPIAACGGKMAGPTTPSAPVPVAASASNLTINGFTSLSGSGETGRLSAFVTFSDGTVQDKSSEVKWSSANLSVATIDGTGLVTAVTDGETLVTATYSNVTGTRRIMVDLP